MSFNKLYQQNLHLTFVSLLDLLVVGEKDCTRSLVSELGSHRGGRGGAVAAAGFIPEVVLPVTSDDKGILLVIAAFLSSTKDIFKGHAYRYASSCYRPAAFATGLVFTAPLQLAGVYSACLTNTT